MRLARTATFALALVTAGVWLLIEVIGAQDRAAVVMGLIPARLSGLVAIDPAVPEWLTPLSSTFVHGGLLHLAFNMLMLVWCGRMVERILGGGSLLILYVIGAYAAALAQWSVDPLSFTPVIGASGAVSAVIGAFALSFSEPRPIVRSQKINRLINAIWLLLTWIVLQILIGWMAGQQGLLLATPAHVGGFLAGLALQRPLLLWRFRSA